MDRSGPGAGRTTGGREAVAPAGWPAQVRPPGVPGWERSAVAWLLDLAPADYRGYPVLTGHPVALARVVAHHVQAQRSGARAALAGARRELREAVPPDALEALLDVLAAEEARLRAADVGVALLEQALRGRRFAPRL